MYVIELGPDLLADVVLYHTVFFFRSISFFSSEASLHFENDNYMLSCMRSWIRALILT